MIPTLSGYREKETLKLTITTNYTDIIQHSSEDNQTQELDNKLGIVIPINEILFISRFDLDIFGKMNAVQVEEENNTQDFKGFYIPN